MKTLAIRKAFLTCIWGVLTATVFVLPEVPITFAQGPPPDKMIGEIEKQFQAIKQIAEDLRQNFLPDKAPKAKGDRPAATAAAEPSAAEQDKDAIERIREEGLNHSQVMQTLSHITDVIGPRLTGSPALKRANEWSSDKLATWGLANSHLEAWGPFGRGWTLKRFSAQIIEPQDIPLVAYPKAWSPGLERPITADVVYFDAKKEADLDKYKGKLKGAIVLLGPTREITAHFEPLALRRTDAELLRMANAGPPGEPRRRREGLPSPAGNRLDLNAVELFIPRQVISFFADMFARSGLKRDLEITRCMHSRFLPAKGRRLWSATATGATGAWCSWPPRRFQVPMAGAPETSRFPAGIRGRSTRRPCPLRSCWRSSNTTGLCG